VLVLEAFRNEAREDGGSPRYLNGLIDHKYEETSAIPLSDTVPKPRAMMIESAHTPFADLAMLRP
jgi:hypothetical protein